VAFERVRWLKDNTPFMNLEECVRFSGEKKLILSSRCGYYLAVRKNPYLTLIAHTSYIVLEKPKLPLPE
jgi:hypothetical protein